MYKSLHRSPQEAATPRNSRTERHICRALTPQPRTPWPSVEANPRPIHSGHSPPAHGMPCTEAFVDRRRKPLRHAPPGRSSASAWLPTMLMRYPSPYGSLHRSSQEAAALRNSRVERHIRRAPGRAATYTAPQPRTPWPSAEANPGHMHARWTFTTRVYNMGCRTEAFVDPRRKPFGKYQGFLALVIALGIVLESGAPVMLVAPNPVANSCG